MGKTLTRLSIMMAIVAALIAVPGPPAANANALPRRCYVDEDATPPGTGGSWATAYTTLQAALADSTCTEIWVAEGVYKPGAMQGFSIGSGVAVYGGFAGGEDSVEARIPATNITILSGDLGGDDDNWNADGNHINEIWTEIAGTNSYHVVLMQALVAPITASTVLDGFTITGGKTAGGGSVVDMMGGGLACASHGAAFPCSPRLRNLVFSGNAAVKGGGMGVFAGGNFESAGNASPLLTNVTFTGNQASSGGGMSSEGEGGTSSPTLANLTFSGNYASNEGGGMFVSGDDDLGGYSHVSLTNVTFSGNSAYLYGGAISTWGGPPAATAALKNVILWGDTISYKLGQDNEIHAPYGMNISDSIVEGGCPPDAASCTNVLTTDPKLGPLANNGGFSPTLTLLAGSSALNAGNDAGCASAPVNGFDQRGVPRPQGPHCDIGAFEATQPAFAAAPTSSNFGLVKVGTTSAGSSFVIRNMGGASMVIGAITLAGANPSQFHLTADTCSSHTIASLGSCTITAAFKPTGAGGKSAAIRIPNNAWGQPHIIQLSGKGGLEQALNGGFNTYPSATARIPTNWTATNFDPTDGRNTAYKKEGTASVKIANTSVRTKTLTQTRMVTGNAGNTFVLSAWAKGQGIPTTAGLVAAQVQLYSGTTLKKMAVIHFPTGAYPFAQRQMAFTAPAAYNKIVIKLTYSKGAGAVWFDGLSLIRAP